MDGGGAGEPVMAPKDQTVALSLISHTNVGKTTLARTLLRREVGEVLDQPHVTDLSEAYTMVETDAGEQLQLWDTPGFGDTARLLRRLNLADQPVGWLLTQVWDRFSDRPFWCSQQAIRNVREEADVVLYLVNATEKPEEAGYVEMEMEVLSWVDKPVILLLNQIGPPRDAATEEADDAAWEKYLEPFPVVKHTLRLDAFARCWVQEGLLLRTVALLLPDHKQDAFEHLSRAWWSVNRQIFKDSMHVLALQLANAACDRELLGKKTWKDNLPDFLKSGWHGDHAFSGKEQAMGELAQRLDAQIRGSTDELIRLHSLEGKASAIILKRLKSDYASSEPVNENLFGLLGSVVSGALSGLVTDILAGGLTFGGGTVAGGILGFLGGKGLAKTYNLIRGEETPCLRWSPVFFEGLVRSALLRYLAVAHFGRGRGDYTESEHPKFWQQIVSDCVARHHSRLVSIWEQAKTASPEQLVGPLAAVLEKTSVAILKTLYPQSRESLKESGFE